MSKNVYEVLAEHGIDRERLDSALKSNDRWGEMIHAFEFLTVASAVLACWPEELS